MTMLYFDATKPDRACLVSAIVLFDVAVTTSVSATPTTQTTTVSILKACAPAAVDAYVCTLVEAPIWIWFRLCKLLASAVQILSNRGKSLRTDSRCPRRTGLLSWRA